VRKFFASAFLVTAVLAVIVGVGVAWTSSATGSTTADAGSLSVALDSSNPGYGPLTNKLYPNNTWTNVFLGQIKNNTPPDPGVDVVITGGSVAVTAANQGCNWSAINGNLAVTNTGPISAGGGIAGQWYAQLQMTPAASNACQGSTVYYDVTVDVGT
jgi:hypothetical protein